MDVEKWWRAWFVPDDASARAVLVAHRYRTSNAAGSTSNRKRLSSRSGGATDLVGHEGTNPGASQGSPSSREVNVGTSAGRAVDSRPIGPTDRDGGVTERQPPTG
jgi:hypothetical protein